MPRNYPMLKLGNKTANTPFSPAMPTEGLTFDGHTDQNIRKHFRWGLKREQIAQIC